MQAGKYRVLVKMTETTDERGYYEKNGIKIYLPSAHNTTATHPRYAEVVSGEHKGKVAYFHQMCFANAKANSAGKTMFELDGERIMAILETDVYFYINEQKQIEMQEGFALCVMDEDKHVEYLDKYGYAKGKISEGGILLLDAKDEHRNTKYAIVKHIAENDDVNVGDKVLLDKSCEIYLEKEFEKTFDEPYVIVETKNMLGVVA